MKLMAAVLIGMLILGCSLPERRMPVVQPHGQEPTVEPLTIAEASDGGVAYSRSAYRHWVDSDSDCQDTRAEILVRDSLVPVRFKSARQCAVVEGLWLGPYSGKEMTSSRSIDIDHMVTLKATHISGAWAWTAERKQAFANSLEPSQLLASSASANRSKGAKDPSEWMPPDLGAWCVYSETWYEVKRFWNLSATQEEWDAIVRGMQTCR